VPGPEYNPYLDQSIHPKRSWNLSPRWLELNELLDTRYRSRPEYAKLRNQFNIIEDFISVAHLLPDRLEANQAWQDAILAMSELETTSIQYEPLQNLILSAKRELIKGLAIVAEEYRVQRRWIPVNLIAQQILMLRPNQNEALRWKAEAERALALQKSKARKRT